MLVHLRLPAPLGVRILDLPSSTPIDDLASAFSTSDVYLRTRSGLIPAGATLSSLSYDNSSFPIDIELCARLRGGKGGFGANLRAAGGRMNASKSTNFDSCRDLSGRRLGTLKEAQKQADLIEELPELRAKAAAEAKAKLEALERQLGVSSASDEKGSGEGSKRIAELDVGELARKKHKFDDNKFIEESREIKENVRNAVGAALLKKRKKKAAAAGAAGDGKEGKEAVKEGAGAAKKAKTATMPPPKVATAA